MGPDARTSSFSFSSASAIGRGHPAPPAAIEWPTVAVAATIWAGLIVVVAGHNRMPAWMTVPVLMYLAGWYASLQHEVVHGHPTPWRWVNSALVLPPIGSVYPYSRFRDLHLAHHRDPDRLTEPGIDNESRYCSAEDWEQAGLVQRLLLYVERTLAGWLTIGVVRGAIRYLAADLRAAARDPRLAAVWARHLAALGITVWLIVGVAGLPVAELVIGLFYGRLVCTGLRTFAEHRWVPDGTRSAVVHASPVTALLFLNNNLHHTHHALPGLPWYRLPAEHRYLDSDAVAATGAGLYPGGYLELWRRFGVRPFCRPIHPADS